MIEGESIIYFGPEPWKGLWRNRHQLMRVFARKNKVLYVEPRSFLRHLLHGRGTTAATPGPRPLSREVLPNLWVLRAPAYTALSGLGPVNAITQGLFRRLVRRQLRRCGMSRPIMWLSRPRMVDLVGAFDEKLTIYHVVDEYSAYGIKTEAQKDRILNLEKRLLTAADMAVVVSRRLLETKLALNERTFLIPNGVDFSLFEKHTERHLETDGGNGQTPPADIARLPRPRVGYSGLVGERLDLGLLTSLAQRQPKTSLVFIGAVNESDCAAQLTALRELPNVHFLGPKPVDEVPAYLHELDVCLIPYRPGEEARNIDPLKLYDYLACARPVVSVDFPAVEPFTDVVEVAAGEEAFIAAVETALADDGSRRERRLELARANTWEARVEQLSEHMEETLTLKTASVVG
jgi:glycosyltransferase involved in cell wall biosynthesis